MSDFPEWPPIGGKKLKAREPTLVPVEMLVPCDDRANTRSVAALVSAMKKKGYPNDEVYPEVKWNGRSFDVVSGCSRVTAAMTAGLVEIPVYADRAVLELVNKTVLTEKEQQDHDTIVEQLDQEYADSLTSEYIAEEQAKQLEVVNLGVRTEPSKEFPKLPRNDVIWRCLYIEPIPHSEEKICVAIIIQFSGEDIEVKALFDKSKLATLFEKASRSISDAIDLCVEEATKFYCNHGIHENWLPTLSSFTLSNVEHSLCDSSQEAFEIACSYSSFHYFR